MKDFMTVIINPEGTRKIVKIKRAIEEINQSTEEEKMKNRSKHRAYYDRLKADPVRWALHQEKKRLGRISKVKG